MKPRLASSKSWGSARFSSWVIASFAFCVATSASPAVPPTPAFLPQPARASRVMSSALPRVLFMVWFMGVSWKD
jgi:hypothetical protein